MHWISRLFDIVIDYWVESFHRQGHAGCDDCVCIEKVSHECSFPTESKCRSATRTKCDRFLRGRQFAYMIYEHFGATGASGAQQGQSDLFNVR